MVFVVLANCRNCTKPASPSRPSFGPPSRNGSTGSSRSTRLKTWTLTTHISNGSKGGSSTCQVAPSFSLPHSFCRASTHTRACLLAASHFGVPFLRVLLCAEGKHDCRLAAAHRSSRSSCTYVRGCSHTRKLRGPPCCRGQR